MAGRNRAEGWKHAKLSGHENEALVEAIVENDGDLQNRLLTCGGMPDGKIKTVDFGGLKETLVDCVLGGKTKSKTDMHLYLDDGKQLNVSIKKSTGGQVYLIGSDRFVDGFEAQFHKMIPYTVKRAIALYWGTAEDTLDIINEYSTKHKAYELRKRRVVKETLDAYDPSLSMELLRWFNENIVDVFYFCFKTGLAKDRIDWADIIWYKNELGENDVDGLFSIKEIGIKLPPTAEYGTRTGGSTIQLPFGFVQWHQGCMQFHHNYEKIKELTE